MELKYKKVISEELEKLESSLALSVSSEIELATEVSNYLVNSWGEKDQTCYLYFSCKSRLVIREMIS